MASNRNALSSHPQKVWASRFCRAYSGPLSDFTYFYTPSAAHTRRWRPWIKYGTISLLASVLVVTLGCVAAPPPAPPVARSFVYTPPEQAHQALGITLALVRPNYADPARLARERQWVKDMASAFTSSMQTDMEKLLIAKGFTVTGPYPTLDVMTYPEKKGANLTLTPIVDISSQSTVTRRTEGFREFSPGREERVLMIEGSISLAMLEPLSGEKMWLKRVEIEPVQEPFVITFYEGTSEGKHYKRILSDTSEQAATVALNRIYPIVMQKAWAYFNPEEITQIKKQADEVRARKVY